MPLYTVEVVISNHIELGAGGRVVEQLFSDSSFLNFFTFNTYLFYLFCMIFLRISFLSKIYGKIVLLKRKKKIKQKEICAYFLFLIMEFLILILTRSYVTRSCYTLLHQVKRIEGKIA